MQLKHTNLDTHYNIIDTTQDDCFIYQLTADTMPSFCQTHSHDKIEIVLVTQGSFTAIIDGVNYAVNKNDVLVITPFCLHSFCGKHTTDLQARAVVFNTKLFFEQSASLPNANAMLFANSNGIKNYVGAADDQSATLVNLLQIVHENTQDVDVVQQTLKNVLQVLFASKNFASQDRSQEKRCYTMKRALQFVADHYTDKLEIDLFAKHCGYSDFYTMKLFKQFTGLPFVEYANMYRLKVASTLLKTSNLDINQIAMQVGYNNISYFNRQFKRLFGVTPKQYIASNK